MKTVYIGIGSNLPGPQLGDREENLRAACERMSHEGIRVVRASSIYETAPQDLANQPWFLNQVVEVETELLPRQLLGTLKRIEKSMGRRKIVAKGPRVIDLDILLYGRAIVAVAGLEIPHPRMAERRFVLEPLAELVPQLRLPSRTRPGPLVQSNARTVLEMLAAVADQEVRRLAPHLSSKST